jgi:hypothetical protein
VVSFTPRPLYPQYTLDRRLGGPQIRSGRCGEQKTLFLLPENRTRALPCVAVLIELSWLPSYFFFTNFLLQEILDREGEMDGQTDNWPFLYVRTVPLCGVS